MDRLNFGSYCRLSRPGKRIVKACLIILPAITCFALMSCSPLDGFIVGNNVMFAGYGCPDNHVTDPVSVKLSWQKNARFSAAMRIANALNGIVLKFNGDKIVLFNSPSATPGYDTVSYSRITPNLYQCVFGINLSSLHIDTWGKTRMITHEVKYPGDFASASIQECEGFLRSINETTARLLWEDAQAYIHDGTLEIPGLFVYNDIQSNGNVKISVIYKVPDAVK